MNNGSPKDWAVLLGVTLACSREALKRAHHDAALRHHPDRGGDSEVMKAANIAKARLEEVLEPLWTASIAT
jgi:curved DNA-binding protein CbpA